MSTIADPIVARLRCEPGSCKHSKIAVETQTRQNRNCDCTRFWHPPVDELHSIENTEDKFAKKELTYKIRTVKNTLVL